MTSIQKFCFEFDIIKADRQSPISKLTSLSDITKKINKFYESNFNEDDPNTFYQCDSSSVHQLFNQNDDYTSSVAVINDNEEATLQDIDDIQSKKVIIVSGTDAPAEENLCLY